MILSQTTQDFAGESAQYAFSGEFQFQNRKVFDYRCLDYNLQGLYSLPQRSAYLIVQGYCQKTNRGNVAKDCVLDYFQEHSLQAYAITSDHHHLVGLSHSLPVVLQMVFQILVSKTNPLTQEYREDNNDIKYPIDLFNPEVSINEIEVLILQTMPEERWQKMMAVRLCEIAVLFCFSHEISHLIRGHARLAKMRNMRGIAEFKTQQPSRRRISHRLSQAWELQADRNALAFLFGYVLNNANYKSRLANALGCNSKTGIDENLLARMLYSLCFVYFLFGYRQTSVQSSTDHPSALTRLTFAIGELSHLYEQRFPGRDGEVFLTLLYSSVNMAQQAWRRMGFSFGDYKDLSENIEQTVRRLSRYDSLSLRFLSHYQWL